MTGCWLTECARPLHDSQTAGTADGRSNLRAYWIFCSSCAVNHAGSARPGFACRRGSRRFRDGSTDSFRRIAVLRSCGRNSRLQSRKGRMRSELKVITSAVGQLQSHIWFQGRKSAHEDPAEQVRPPAFTVTPSNGRSRAARPAATRPKADIGLVGLSARKLSFALSSSRWLLPTLSRDRPYRLGRPEADVQTFSERTIPTHTSNLRRSWQSEPGRGDAIWYKSR